jgi:hypothetical protein
MKVFASLLLIFFTGLSSSYAQDPDRYNSLTVAGQTLSIRGHKIEINPDGFLKQVGGEGYLSDSIAKLHQILYEETVQIYSNCIQVFNYRERLSYLVGEEYS